jgi:hypothetical protein
MVDDVVQGRLESRNPGTGKPPIVAIVFATLMSRRCTEGLLKSHLNSHVWLVSHRELIPDEWVDIWTADARDVTQFFLPIAEDDDIEFIAKVDELHVIFDGNEIGGDSSSAVSHGIENLMWRAFQNQVPVSVIRADGMSIEGVEKALLSSGTPERLAVIDASWHDYMNTVNEIHVCCDFGSSGLWNNRGNMLGYDVLVLPFSFVRRIAAWQQNFDETFNPPDDPGKGWDEWYLREELAIARELQLIYGDEKVIKVDRGGDWVPVCDARI